MAQKPDNSRKNLAKKKNKTWNLALNFFIGGCCAELFMLLIRNCYIYGTIEQVIAWDNYLQYFLYAGLALTAVGLIAALCFLKKPGWKRTTGWILFTAGAFVALASLLSRLFYSTAVNFFCMMIPAVILLGILWCIYDRECAWALTILGADVVALWICRRGLHSEYVHTMVLAGAVIAIVLAAAAAFLFWKADKNGGTLGKLRLLPPEGDPLPVYVACGVSVVSIALALFSTTVAYYAIWVVAIVIFALAVYYTVRQL